MDKIIKKIGNKYIGGAFIKEGARVIIIQTNKHNLRINAVKELKKNIKDYFEQNLK